MTLLGWVALAVFIVAAAVAGLGVVWLMGASSDDWFRDDDP
jgi:flagellar basal body-associated protein FliL